MKQLLIDIKIFLKKQYKSLIIVFLAILILLQSFCNRPIIASTKTTVKIDTVFVEVKDTITKEVKVSSIKYVYPKEDKKYTSGETLDTCKLRFQNLLKEHIAKTV